MATVEDRLTVLETEFRTELRHLATKNDLADLENRLNNKLWAMSGLMIATVSVGVAVLRFWS